MLFFFHIRFVLSQQSTIFKLQIILTTKLGTHIPMPQIETCETSSMVQKPTKTLYLENKDVRSDCAHRKWQPEVPEVHPVADFLTFLGESMDHLEINAFGPELFMT